MNKRWRTNGGAFDPDPAQHACDEEGHRGIPSLVVDRVSSICDAHAKALLCSQHVLDPGDDIAASGVYPRVAALFGGLPRDRPTWPAGRG